MACKWSGLGSALPCPAGRSGPWPPRTGAPKASATRRDRNPDAHEVANETVQELARQGKTGRDRQTEKPLLRHTTVDSRLSGEKALERLRA
jgi:hypothetical protein